MPDWKYAIQFEHLDSDDNVLDSFELNGPHDRRLLNFSDEINLSLDLRSIDDTDPDRVRLKFTAKNIPKAR